MHLQSVLLGIALGTLAGLALATFFWRAPRVDKPTASHVDSHMPSAATGLGGVFFRARDPSATIAWYAQHLGIPVREVEGQKLVLFAWRENDSARSLAHTVWSPMPASTDYFDAGEQKGGVFMINYRVRDLATLLAQLRSADIHIVGEPQTYFNGRFAWILDLDGRKVELWEPSEGY